VSRRLGVVLGMAGIAAVSACAPPTAAHVPEPVACADSQYVALKREPPDSLSEREWQRLQALDRDCATARSAAQGTHDQSAGMMGMGRGHGGGWRMLGLVAIAVMVVTMSTLW
jgi:hypothetical protein